MRFKGGAWKPVVAELRLRLIVGTCSSCGESFLRCICGKGNVYKMLKEIERLFKYYVQWFGFEKMEFLRMRQKVVDLRRRSLKQYHKDQDTIRELQGYVKTLEANVSNSTLRRLSAQLDEEVGGDHVS